jgi:class 3 adenylate cyclase
MAAESQTRFVRTDGVHIAYQVIGSGATDLLLIDSWFHNVELVWELPEFASVLRRLASFGRLIHFDRRGTGLSDPVNMEALPDLEAQVEDAVAVLDAADSERAAVVGLVDGTVLAMLLAAAHPERCSSLILFAGSVGGHGWSEEANDRVAAEMEADLARGGGGSLALLAPSLADDERFVARFAQLQRSAVRPGVIRHYLLQTMRTDVRKVLPTIGVPTLFLHRTGDRFVPVELAREAARLVPNARLLEVPGDDHLFYVGDAGVLLDEIEEFVTGMRGMANPDRILATLLFTDIVGSTKLASELGDRRWRDLLDEHHRLVRREIERFRGHEIDTAGDGFLTTFESPGRAVHCAIAIQETVRPLGLDIRAGIHTGEVEVRGSGNVAGLAVHIAARVASLAAGGEVLVSSTVRELLAGSEMEFETRGEHELKGVPGTWRLYALVPG